MSTTPGGTTPAPQSAQPSPKPGRRSQRRATSVMAHGEPWIWLTGGALTLAMFMIIGLLVLIVWQGSKTFWPGPVYEVKLVQNPHQHAEAHFVGELFRSEYYDLRVASVGNYHEGIRRKIEPMFRPSFEEELANLKSRIGDWKRPALTLSDVPDPAQPEVDTTAPDKPFVQEIRELVDAAGDDYLRALIDYQYQFPEGSPPRRHLEDLLGAMRLPTHRFLLRTGNFDVTNTHFNWIADFQVATPSFEVLYRDGKVWVVRKDTPEHAGLVEGTIPASYVSQTLRRPAGITFHAPDHQTINDFASFEEGISEPEWVILIERLAWGRFYGFPREYKVDGEVKATGFEPVWEQFTAKHDEVRALAHERRRVERSQIGRVNRELEWARQEFRGAELRYKPSISWISAYNRLVEVRRGGTAEEIAEAEADVRLAEEDDGIPDERFMAAVKVYEQRLAEGNEAFLRISEEITKLNREMARYEIVLTSVQGLPAAEAQAFDERWTTVKGLSLHEIVRTFEPNQMTFVDRLRIYFSRWVEFIFADPREANMEGGVWPAIVGTVTMTLIMSLLVVPFGVLAALYLREYAKAGPLISAVRIAINNLAGVPSIVFGVFGLGFFCYIMGWGIDQLFYEENLPNPTYGKGGLLWASLTLALLTLPVVIVATEEALAAVPSSMREGSYACGASKWQTIWRIVLPRAMPGIMTGAILSMARGAGEVAPLMLVGAVKLAPDLPVDLNNFWGSFGPIPTGPLHPQRSFMHLGFHIYDVGFQSQNSEAARPVVFTTTLLLVALITVLNLAAIWLRTRLRRRFITSQF